VEIKASNLQQGLFVDSPTHRLQWNDSGYYEIISKKDKGKIVYTTHKLSDAVKEFNTFTGYIDIPVEDSEGMPNYYEVQTMRNVAGRA
jgi:hypothetical protein